MKKAQQTIKPSGFSLVEVLLSVSIFSMLVTVMIGAYLYGQESIMLSGNRVRATLLAEEALEATKNIRDEDWANLTDGTHGLQVSGNQWEFSGNSDQSDIFTRELNISSIDSNRKQITSTITWEQNGQRAGNISMQTLLSHWKEIISTGIGDWSVPLLGSVIDLSGGNNGLKVKVVGDHAYLIRSGGSNELQIINVSNPNNPFTEGALSISGTPTNLDVDGDYAYITTTDNSREVVVIDISNSSSPNQIDTYNLSGNNNAQGIMVVGSLAYVVRDDSSQDEFYVFDISDPSDISELGATDLNDDGNEVIVIGSYAYVATDGDELEVVDISNSNAPQSIADLNLSGGSNAFTITGAGNTVYLGRANGRIESVDISDPFNPNALSNLDNGSAVRDLDLGNNNTYLFAASDQNDAEFQLIDVSNPNSISTLSTYNAPADFNGVDYDSDKDRAFFAAEDNEEELTILTPQ